MNITVIRHGKVDMCWPCWCNAEEFDAACCRYESTDIVPIYAKKKNSATGNIYVSTQSRSLKTAEALFGDREYIQMSGLCEVPLRSFAKLRLRLPLWIWNVAGRLQWYFGSRRQPESRGDTVKRAKAVILQIEKDEECIVVTHGFFMKTFLGQLKKAGYVLEGDRAFGFHNLHIVRAACGGKRKKGNNQMKWEENVRKVVPYVPGEQPQKKDIIKLNTNECPYPPSPMVQKAMREMDYQDLRLYPEFPEKTPLTAHLAEYYHVKEEQIFIGVGSDDVLSMAFLTFFNSDKPVFFPDITYSFYDVWADIYRIPYEVKPLDADFCIRKEDYMAGECGGIIFPNPNAPTGVLMGVEEIEDIIKANSDVVVIIDEAYIDFGGTSCLPLLKTYDNLLVVRTFSKSRAMAGSRIGYAIGNEKLIGYLNDAKYSVNSYTMNRPALRLGAESVKDDAYFREICGKIIKTRERSEKELAALGFSFPKSYGNFLFVSHEKVAAQEIFEKLKEHDIYVRHWNKARIDNYLRITIGTDEEMDALFTALREIV